MPRILLRVLLVLGGTIGLYVLFFPVTYGLTARMVGWSVKSGFVLPEPARP